MIAVSLLLILVGLVAMVVSPALGVLIIVVSALLFVIAGRRRRESLEEQRHREMLAVMREKKL